MFYPLPLDYSNSIMRVNGKSIDLVPENKFFQFLRWFCLITRPQVRLKTSLGPDHKRENRLYYDKIHFIITQGTYIIHNLPLPDFYLVC